MARRPAGVVAYAFDGEPERVSRILHVIGGRGHGLDQFQASLLFEQAPGAAFRDPLGLAARLSLPREAAFKAGDALFRGRFRRGGCQAASSRAAIGDHVRAKEHCGSPCWVQRRWRKSTGWPNQAAAPSTKPCASAHMLRADR